MIFSTVNTRTLSYYLFCIVLCIVWTSQVCSAKLSLKTSCGFSEVCSCVRPQMKSAALCLTVKYKGVWKQNQGLCSCLCSHPVTHTYAHTAASHCCRQPMPRGTLFMTNQKDTGGCVRQHSSQLTGNSSSDMWAEQRLKTKGKKSNNKCGKQQAAESYRDVVSF